MDNMLPKTNEQALSILNSVILVSPNLDQLEYFGDECTLVCSEPINHKLYPLTYNQLICGISGDFVYFEDYNKDPVMFNLDEIGYTGKRA